MERRRRLCVHAAALAVGAAGAFGGCAPPPHVDAAAVADSAAAGEKARALRREGIAALGACERDERTATARAAQVAQACRRAAVGVLIEAAREGDRVALVTLEKLRERGAPEAPDDAVMMSIERERATLGDPVSAWRLVQRYRAGEPTRAASGEYLRWLTIAAGSAAPFSADAAFFLCEAFANGVDAPRDSDRAAQWCERAAAKGHRGAVIALGRLRANVF